MGNKLYIVGVGPGDRNYMVPAAEKVLEDSDVIIGGKRNLEMFAHLDREKLVIGNNLAEIQSYIEEHIPHKKIAVAVTGDPGIYSILSYLQQKLRNIEIEVVPGVSSLQYLCGKLKTRWNDLYIASLHGREEEDVADIVVCHSRTALFTGGDCTPAVVCRRLLEKGVRGLRVAVGESLSYPEERIVEGTPEEVAEVAFGSLTIMIIWHTESFSCRAPAWDYTTAGIPDALFDRGEVPMTKEEIRAVSVSKLRLAPGSTVLDIGAGTGSVAVECALQCRKGKVLAVEKNEEGIALIENNAKKFGVTNMQIIHGEAPAALQDLAAPDRVFIGGSSGRLEDIIGWVDGHAEKVRVVVNAVTVESVYEALEGFKKYGFRDLELINLAVSRGRPAGGKHLMQALNPVYIISAEK